MDVGPPVTVIRAGRQPLGAALAELWARRELVWFVAWRDLRVRYKQTLLGVGWALAKPLAATAVFALIFGRVVRLPADGLPYASFVLAALVGWQLFSAALTAAAGSLVHNGPLVTKVYVPRLALPLAAALPPLADYALACLAVVAVAWLQGLAPGPALAGALPLGLAVWLLAVGLGLGLASLEVRWRDVHYVLVYGLQLLLFASPVVYSASALPAEWRALAGLNPLVGLLGGLRWAFLGAQFPGQELALSAALIAAALLGGLLLFRLLEPRFADYL